MVPATSVRDLLARYDVFLLDAYGVLVSQAGVLPGAAAFLRALREAGKRYMVVSNDASRSVAHSVARYRGFGLELEGDQFLCAGMLLARYFEREGLKGSACMVLGTSDSAAYVRAAGGVVVAPMDMAAAVVVIADDSGFPFLETIEDTLTTILHRLDCGQSVRLVLPNPDLIYPKGNGEFGLTAGSIALVLEHAIRARLPGATVRSERLGKPEPLLFEEALRRLGATVRDRVVVGGDQLATDIAGANAAGLDSVLVTSGVSRPDGPTRDVPGPTWVLEGLE